MQLSCERGFDSGVVTVSDGEASYEVTFLNEYMTVERKDERVATFPDLLVLADRRTGLPLPSCEVRERAYLGQGF